MSFFCDDRRRQINQWGKIPNENTPSCVHSQCFAISRAAAGAEEHSQDTGYPTQSSCPEQITPGAENVLQRQEPALPSFGMCAASSLL